jgi:hypothetical protein
MRDDTPLVIHHRKSKSCVMLIPSRIGIARPTTGKATPGQPELYRVDRKHHRVFLDAQGYGEICGAVWKDIEASGYGNHFLIMPNEHRPKKQMLVSTAAERAIPATTPEADGNLVGKLITKVRRVSTGMQLPDAFQ